MMTKNVASWNDLALKQFSVDKKTKKNSRPDLIWLQTIQILTGYSHSLNLSLVRYTLNRKSLASIGAITLKLLLLEIFKEEELFGTYSNATKNIMVGPKFNF